MMAARSPGGGGGGSGRGGGGGESIVGGRGDDTANAVSTGGAVRLRDWLLPLDPHTRGALLEHDRIESTAVAGVSGIVAKFKSAVFFFALSAF